MNRDGPVSHGDALRAVWEEHRAGLLDRACVIERAIAALGSTQLDEPLRIEARQAAHMLSGSLGLFGFTREAETAYELQLELECPEPSRARALSALAAVVRSGLDHELPAHMDRQPTQAGP
jgi:HPt (histidine-containing phosphotransfer) domain-containing protein